MDLPVSDGATQLVRYAPGLKTNNSDLVDQTAKIKNSTFVTGIFTKISGPMPKTFQPTNQPTNLST